MKEEALLIASRLDTVRVLNDSKAQESVLRQAQDWIRRLVAENEFLKDWRDTWSPHVNSLRKTKPSKCIVKDCENHKHQGSFTGDLCNPCYEFIATGKGVYSQAYRNTQTKPLSDEEIWEWFEKNTALTKESALRIARAIEERHGIK